MPRLLHFIALLWNLTQSFSFISRGKDGNQRHISPLRSSVTPSLAKSRYTTKEPLQCVIRSVKQVGSNGFDREFYHIVIDSMGKYAYTDGEYCGIIPPGISEKTNRRHTPRSYSLAPLLDGDGDDTSCFSICVRTTICKDDSPHSSSMKGICSTFLSRSEPGTPVSVTGPFGKNLTLSPDDLHNNLIFVATGTGISPFRGFLRTLEKKSKNKDPNSLGRILLFFGVQNYSTYIYRSELEKYVDLFNGRFMIIPCFSRHSVASERGYVQDNILKSKDLIASMAETSKDKKCSIFICGRKGMEVPVREALSTAFGNLPNRDSLLNNIKIEVYQ
ncbi:oxidoreductase NAD-binding domain containing protein [Theileria equi strain WA]|uniref:ferredoxin--NADP(+) reductase n=1 Tax=Theileria equi strain WA TaxID=1537102 RepID=L1LGK4_THEEQ|nr:oxidoreductase NAD-binding domain containing protein [Theileria equi strain WA]EKX74248.1 oxidoreductase NAD-binding domain containing protein [Theileria equi strain WA]|eukprot:XP_004833700.1 oxidoreductase NAD-binding domain containing protein [Theileria equi strain WA]